MVILTEYLKYIESETSRRWLEEHSEYLKAEDIADLIMCARADIRDKLHDMKRLAKKSDADLSNAVRYLEKAVSLMDSQGDAIFLKTVHYYEEDGDDCDESAPYVSFYKAVDSMIEEKNDEDLDEEGYASISWYVINRYDLKNGEYEYTARFTVGHDGSVWAAEIEGEKYYHDDLNIVTPFVPGDIITFDAEPFHPTIHAVVIWKTMISADREDCCSPFILYKKEDGLHYEALKHIYCGELFSPLLRAEIYEGELNDDEQILCKVSDYIKTHENGAAEIDDILIEDHDLREERLMQLLGVAR